MTLRVELARFLSRAAAKQSSLFELSHPMVIVVVVVVVVDRPRKPQTYSSMDSRAALALVSALIGSQSSQP